jgi:hypothetical protein
MEQSTLGVLLTCTDNATPQLKQLGATVSDNRMELRQLAMGVGFLGMQFSMMGMMARQSETAIGKNVGTTLMYVGALMTALSTAVQFVRSIQQVTAALKGQAVMQALVNALTGPGGWAKLAVGGALAFGAVAGINAMTKNEQKVTIENKVLLDGKQIGESARRAIIHNQMQNGNRSGIQ